MNYVNAYKVLPEELLALVQEYAGGQLLYIPKPENRHKAWGENTGTRIFTRERNRQMRRSFRQGTSVTQLAELYFLSPETVKKIVYCKSDT